ELLRRRRALLPHEQFDVASVRPVLLALHLDVRHRLVHRLAPSAEVVLSGSRRNTLHWLAVASAATPSPKAKRGSGCVCTRSTGPESSSARYSLMLPRKVRSLIFAGTMPAWPLAAVRRMFSGRMATSTASPARAPSGTGSSRRHAAACTVARPSRAL